jgi:hypothetical protein
MKNGYYLRAYGYDCFYVTNAKNKTKKLVIDFINKIQNKINVYTNIDENTIAIVQKRAQRATLTIKTTTGGAAYYDINGEDFGGLGGFINDNDTIIVYANKEV